jgi:vacuolar-type H+-ATPase subunit E/Vma4
MALAELLSALERDVETRVSAELAAAQAEADRVTRDVDARIAAQREQVLTRHADETRARLAHHLAETRASARRELLSARERMLRDVFDTARTRLAVLVDDPAYRASLASQVSEALSYLDGHADLTAVCSPGLVEVMRRALGEHPLVDVVPDPAVGTGFRIATADGKVDVDQTLEVRLTRMQDIVAMEIVRILEGDEADAVG